MFSRFRRSSRSVRFEDDSHPNSRQNTSPSVNESKIDEEKKREEEVEEAKQMIRRPSLARRMSHTLLRRKSSTTTLKEEEDEEEDVQIAITSLYTWGRNDYGQLLRDTREKEPSETTTNIIDDDRATREFESPVSQFALGLFHSLICTTRGTSWGSGDNEDGQLDNTQPADFFNGARPLRGSESLQSKKSCSIAVGLKHSALVTKDGLVLTWGSNESGQLGHSKDSLLKVAPKQLDGNVRRERCVQVACSEGATFILTEKGQVWSTGEATRGELGRPEALETGCSWLASPILGRLFCNPVTMISAGAAHVIAITVTGKALGWGWNRHGQLGFKPQSDAQRFEPSPVALNIPCLKVVSGSCGTQHTAFVSKEGLVYTAGSGESGQLGRPNDEEDEGFKLVPNMTNVAKVACGSYHTVVLLKSGKVFAFGSNEFGEIYKTSVQEEKIFEPFECISGNAIDIGAGGRNSCALMLVNDQEEFEKRFQRRGRKPRMHELDCKTLIKLCEDAVISSSFGGLKGAMGEFHATGLNRSFISEETSSKVDMAGVQLSLSLVSAVMSKKKAEEKWLIERFSQLHKELKELAEVATEPDQLRAFFIALINPNVVNMPSSCYSLLVRALARLKDASLDLIAQWTISDCGLEVFTNIILKQLLKIVDFAAEKRDWSEKGCAPAAVRVLKKLHELSPPTFVSFEKFYVNQPDHWAHHVIIDEWRRFVKRDHSAAPATEEFSLFDHPFVISAETKRNVMMYDQQNSQIQNAVTAALSQAGSPFFEITVRREYILEDALGVLLKSKRTELTKPLRMAFENEPGLDWGGVRKEFFELLSATLFDPKKVDFFCHPDPENSPSLLWLSTKGKTVQLVKRAEKVQTKRKERFLQSPERAAPIYLTADSFSCAKRCGSGLHSGVQLTPHSFCDVCGVPLHVGVSCIKCSECSYNVCLDCKEEDVLEETQAWQKVVLVGALMGLSVYSSTLLDVHFPLALYSGLLDKPVNTTLEELGTIDSSLARGLRSMLEINDEEMFEATFGDQTFYLEDMDQELIPDGKNINLTLDNRELYCKRRCEFELRDGVAPLLNALMTGFRAVVDVHGDAMSLFSPPELELMIVGVPDLDFAGLEKASRYEGGYTPSTPVVTWFWKICEEELDTAHQHLLLSFVTGSSRAPIGGLANQSILIQRAGPDSEQLPTAHTCFNTLLLPEYTSKEKLKEKLGIALLNAQGFGLQ